MGAVSLLQFELFLAHKSDTSRTGQYKSARHITDLLRTHSGIRRTMPDESRAARLHIGLIDNLNARLPRHTPIACDGFITLGLWLSVSIRSRLSSLTSHLRHVKPEMLSLGFRVIAHLWAGTAHRPTIGNNVTPDPIFNFQVAV